MYKALGEKIETFYYLLGLLKNRREHRGSQRKTTSLCGESFPLTLQLFFSTRENKIKCLRPWWLFGLIFPIFQYNQNDYNQSYKQNIIIKIGVNTNTYHNFTP